jgi:nitroreductase
MDKPAPTDIPVHPLVRQRWSPRAFDPSRPVDDATLRSLLEAARWSPSCFNEQPWAYILGRMHQEPDAHARILSCLTPANQAWARNAPLLIIAAAKAAFDKNAKPNRHATHDVGQSLAWLTVQAESMTLRVHQMAGIDPDRCRTQLGIPAGWDPITGVAVGSAGPLDILPEDVRVRETAPRVRRPVAEWAFTGAWGASA